MARLRIIGDVDKMTTKALRAVSLDDKYTATTGAILLTGTQALVRLPLDQRRADRRAGLNTAGYISGYRGSPIGGYDSALWRAQAQLEAEDIVFQPGLNEDLAATAICGTQQIDTMPGAKVDGVFAIWYGKGPGVDRSVDALKHANLAGTHRHGGVVVVGGDDHIGKSSIVAHQSETAFIHCLMPVLAASSVEDCVELGLLGFALSRYSGLYVGFTAANEVLEQTATMDLNLLAGRRVVIPKDRVTSENVYYRPTHIDRQASEIVLHRHRFPLLQQFLRANPINRTIVDAPRRRLGIITAGKAFQDCRQALTLLGLDDARAARMGVSLHKIGCVWPLEPVSLRAFAAGHEELLIVEEKAPIVEQQVAALLYDLAERPRITSKTDEAGQPQLARDIQLQPTAVALAIAKRLERLNCMDDELRARVRGLEARALFSEAIPLESSIRAPFFCSGCPHNSSTKQPDDSYTIGGIGCHSMAMYTQERVLATTQMGGEGASWIGLSPFSSVDHVFQNMGDGTYYHSGLLAVRAAVAAKVNITFKILYNDAVAMTGGQPIDGPLSAEKVTQQVMAEGASRCVIVSDTPEVFEGSKDLGPGVTIFHRDRLDEIQRALRATPGVTCIVYAQTCAAEKRRRRKRKAFPNPPKRMFINAAVCEGCGDCSVQSHCVSIAPLETELGRKRQIDQSTCNKDYSCVNGFCPSFVTIAGGDVKRPAALSAASIDIPALPDPPAIRLGADGYGVMVSGIGGTGVVTVGAVLAMAAHLEGLEASVFDMTGLAQKNGAVYSHVRIVGKGGNLGAANLGFGEAQVAMAFDMVAALSPEAVRTVSEGKTVFVANSKALPTASFQFNSNALPDENAMAKRIVRLVGKENAFFVDGAGLALALLGDTIASNLFVLGYALQLGFLPVGAAAVERAIEINGASVPMNIRAFRYGRAWALDPGILESRLEVSKQPEAKALTALADIVAHRSDLLREYQSDAYVERYQRLVAAAAAAETAVAPGSQQLGVAVAQNFAKLLAYKDEYEVGRLYSRPEFIAAVQAQFQGDYKIRFNLAPPLFAKKDPKTGHLKKSEYGPWMIHAMRLLGRLKFLRDTPFDVFGYSAERKMERGLIDAYEAGMQKAFGKLQAGNLPIVVALAGIPDLIKGYGHVKEANVALARKREQALWSTLDNPPAPVSAAAAPPVAHAD
jgi:indolepyruvate ferredoxin oxidoreductase